MLAGCWNMTEWAVHNSVPELATISGKATLFVTLNATARSAETTVAIASIMIEQPLHFSDLLGIISNYSIRDGKCLLKVYQKDSFQARLQGHSLVEYDFL